MRSLRSVGLTGLSFGIPTALLFGVILMRSGVQARTSTNESPKPMTVRMLSAPRIAIEVTAPEPGRCRIEAFGSLGHAAKMQELAWHLKVFSKNNGIDAYEIVWEDDYSSKSFVLPPGCDQMCPFTQLLQLPKGDYTVELSVQELLWTDEGQFGGIVTKVSKTGSIAIQ